MRGWLVKILGVLGLALAVWGLFWAFPVPPAGLAPRFDASALESGPLEAYFAAREARYDDITQGTQARVIWAGAPGAASDWVVLYLHGFSASSEEIRPVPDRVADALDANLIYTRLRGHGRPGAVLAEARVGDWMADVAEGLAAARRAGRRVLVIATSTGGTLMAEAALQPGLADDVAGIVFISPNFGINSSAAPLLSMPGARVILPLLVGREREWQPKSEAHGRFWTTRYPVAALVPMARLVRHAAGLPVEAARIPALFHYAPRDSVVRADLTREIAARWGRDGGGAVRIEELVEGGPGWTPISTSSPAIS